MSPISQTVHFDDLGINRREINGDLRSARNQTMLAILGSPRGSFDQTCRPPTNPRIRNLVETADLGPFRATGLKPALDTLRAVFADIRAEHPQIHDAMSSAGMLCCRLVRGSSTSISNHSWGTAIDLRLEGQLDARGDNRVQRGLLTIHPFFNRHGYFWGAAFRTEDAMHFEASDQLVRQWARDGQLGDTPGSEEDSLLTFGDRGPEVEELQVRLMQATQLEIDVDGVFGGQTLAVVKEFQRRSNLRVDGVVGPVTMAALKDAAGNVG